MVRVANHWNQLSREIVESLSMEMGLFESSFQTKQSALSQASPALSQMRSSRSFQLAVCYVSALLDKIDCFCLSPEHLGIKVVSKYPRMALRSLNKVVENWSAQRIIVWGRDFGQSLLAAGQYQCWERIINLLTGRPVPQQLKDVVFKHKTTSFPYSTTFRSLGNRDYFYPLKDHFLFFSLSVIFIGFFSTEEQFIALTFSGNTENIRSGKEFGEIKTRAAKEIFRK